MPTKSKRKKKPSDIIDAADGPFIPGTADRPPVDRLEFAIMQILHLSDARRLSTDFDQQRIFDATQMAIVWSQGVSVMLVGVDRAEVFTSNLRILLQQMSEWVVTPEFSADTDLWRRMVDDLRWNWDRLRMAEKVADPPMLSPHAALVYNILLANDPHVGMTGPRILLALQGVKVIIDQSTLTKNIIPALRSYGVEHVKRLGYRIPPSARPKPTAPK